MSAGQLASVNNIDWPKQKLHSSLFNGDVKLVSAQQHLVKEVIEIQRKFGQRVSRTFKPNDYVRYQGFE